ncbi:hypothetical protein SDC9_181510 [bioreactor metagenome]|uniref:Uncharacterized protein n=1 Tax=bioreactor metagenome TaxID=1076179 RepID=A0A645H4V5_9ZZZZ
MDVVDGLRLRASQLYAKNGGRFTGQLAGQPQGGDVFTDSRIGLEGDWL